MNYLTALLPDLLAVDLLAGSACRFTDATSALSRSAPSLFVDLLVVVVVLTASPPRFARRARSSLSRCTTHAQIHDAKIAQCLNKPARPVDARARAPAPA
jgi:hypothetical protein